MYKQRNLKYVRMLLCAKSILQYFKNIKAGVVLPPLTDVTRGGQTTPLLKVLKYCKNLLSALNMLIYFTIYKHTTEPLSNYRAGYDASFIRSSTNYLFFYCRNLDVD